MFIPRLHLYSYPDPRESKIQKEIIRLGLDPEEITAFRTIADHLDYFVWDGVTVDLRTKKAALPQLLSLPSYSRTTRGTEGI